jgi:DNA polymerase
MIQAMSHGLPGSLDQLCGILQISADKAKDKRGKQLINLFCKPRPEREKIRRATYITHPKEWQQFIDYAKSDIEATREIYLKLPKWNYSGDEYDLWVLDQNINDRGVCVDVELANAAIDAINKQQLRISARTQELTEDGVKNTTQRDVVLRYIAKTYGIDLPDLKAANVEKLLKNISLPVEMIELLSLRLQATTTSTAKYKALTKAVNEDHRLRGTLQFCGATRTGRWSGRTFQPQNLPRPSHKNHQIEQAIDAIKSGIIDLYDQDDTMKLISSCIRGCIVAPEGKKIVAADLSNIEGRVAVWLANETWKLDAFAEYDLGTGSDLYVLAYAKAFRVDPATVTKAQRQIGKVMELALGYGGGVGAFTTFALAYNMNLDELAEAAIPNIPTHIVMDAEGMLQWLKEKKTNNFGLADNVFVACDGLKRLWRYAHPEISSYWGEIELAAREATMFPDRYFQAKRLRFIRTKNWLRMILPSGRSICYAAPSIEDNSLTYMGVNQFTRQWSRIHTYGGKLFENACQAVARDVMGANMPTIDNAGYKIVLSVHDELITEAPDTPDYTAAHLSKLMATQPKWAQTLPLAASGFEAYRYRKDD